MVVGRWGFEVYGQAGGRDPVAVAVVPWGRAQLGADDRREVLVAKGPRVGDPPSVLGLEVVRKAEEVVAGVAVGADDVFGTPLAVRKIRVAVEVAAEEAALPAPQQIPCQGYSSLRLALRYSRFSSRQLTAKEAAFSTVYCVFPDADGRLLEYTHGA
jgi:hypothetical protein